VPSGAALALGARLALVASSMRAAGARVGVGELLGAHRALAAVDASDRRTAYFALRAALCSRREDLEAFDAAFDAAFGPPGGASGAPTPEIDPVATAVLPRVGVPLAGELVVPPDAEVVRAAWSEVEQLREKDFADYTESELRLAHRLIRQLARTGPRRPSRRTRASHTRGGRPDLRRTVRASMRYGGEPFERHWRRPGERARPLVLVCDVSGSMEPYARMLLAYLQACVAARRRVEAFVFGTRLTRVTGELRGRDPDRALARAAGTVEDWSGGTRIGESLAVLNREHGRRLGRGAVVVILSDGWDRGDPELLEREMQRLSRCAHALVWLNPLKAHPEYEPLTRGMVAALPHVDSFLAGNSLASLEELAAVLEKGVQR
jgi:uncharacterized protein